MVQNFRGWTLFPFPGIIHDISVDVASIGSIVCWVPLPPKMTAMSMTAAKVVSTAVTRAFADPPLPELLLPGQIGSDSTWICMMVDRSIPLVRLNDLHLALPRDFGHGKKSNLRIMLANSLCCIANPKYEGTV